MRAKDTLGLSEILSHTKHEMRVQMDHALKRLGFSAAQYGVLSALESAGRATNAELARRCYVRPQTMIRILRNLEARGFLRSNAHAEHGLKIEFELTQKAEDVLCKAHVLIYKLERRMTKGLSETAIRQLHGHLKTCFNNLNKAEPGNP